MSNEDTNQTSKIPWQIKTKEEERMFPTNVANSCITSTTVKVCTKGLKMQMSQITVKATKCSPDTKLVEDHYK